MTHHYKDGERRLVCPKDGGCRVHPKQYKTCSDDESYSQFQELHKDSAAVIKRTMFKLLRPFFIVPPESRTCVCPYCKIALQIIADYIRIFGLCHGEDCPCECLRCERGDCKDKLLNQVAKKVFWYIEQGEVDHAPPYEVSGVPGSASNFSFVPSVRPWGSRHREHESGIMCMRTMRRWEAGGVP